MLPQKSGDPLNSLIEFIKRAIAAEVDLFQIRERDLSARDLLYVSDAAAKLATGTNTRILVNDRADIAACAGVGVHLRTASLRPEVVRQTLGSGLLVGASTHSIEEATAAELGGVDFVVLGPIFETESKRVYGPPIGSGALKRVASRLRIPVLALGGIREDNIGEALDAGAAGIAGISIFARSEGLERLVRTIKNISGSGSAANVDQAPR
jgi:thiamine-phosphate pyrophosphorylase